jgi:hypothetical protein
VANALVTARLRATQSNRPATMPTAATTAAPAPPNTAADMTNPVVASSMDSAGRPTRAAANSPVTMVRRSSGSRANRAGSNDSSTPKKTSGRNSQPSTSRPPPSAAITPVARTSWSRPGMENAK